jgi:tricarballylate dehydrogenase
MNDQYDVCVAGAGNAALCAAISAAENGAHVLVLERAPQPENGGNSRFTAGGFRFVYNGVDDLRDLCDLSESEIEMSEFGSYTEDQFFDDMFRVTEFRCDPDLVEVLVRNSLPTIRWLHNRGVRFVPMYGRQAFKTDGKFRFWGGLSVEARGGGPGLVDMETEIAKQAGVEIRYGAKVTSLLYDGEQVEGVVVRENGKIREIHSRSVVLATGGFEANPEMRSRYLGRGWELAKVRGTRFNTGTGIRMAIDIGAAPYGNWSSCHAVAWDLNAPEFGDLAVGDQFQKHSYPFSIIVNLDGERFLDEGADLRNYTYAKYGRTILEQSKQTAWQIFDAKVQHLLRDEYHIQKITKVSANTIEELAEILYHEHGMNRDQFVRTVADFNAAVHNDISFDPTIKDGRSTDGLAVKKSNWAMTLDTPPFEAYGVTCGITFTFGGLRITPNAEVLDEDLEPITGLFAAGELVGGLFYHNYPGGTGLMNGSVFGRIAGNSAANY